MRASHGRIGVLVAVLALALIAPAGAEAHHLSFNATSYSVPEFSAFKTITVNRTGSGTTVHVDYATSDGTATAGLDYTAVSGTLDFGPSDSQKSFAVPILDDALIEGDETVNLALTNAQPTYDASLGTPNTAVLTILDDDSNVQFSLASYGVDESAGKATIEVTRTGLTTGTSTVAYATSDGTALDGQDYTATSGTLTFGPGVTSQTFDVPIVDDQVAESFETFNVALSNAGPLGTHVGSPGTAVVGITDNDDITPTVTAPDDRSAAGAAATSAVVAAARAPLRAGSVALDAACDRRCTVRAFGHVLVGARRFGAHTARAVLPNGGRARLALPLSTGGRAAVRDALAHHRRMLVSYTVVWGDGLSSGHRLTRSFRVRG
jgi:Calx-beta domain-containing protein